MKLSLIPYPGKITYLDGFTSVNTEVRRETSDALSEECYTLYINGTITVTASSESGFFYAEKTLEQIKYQCGQNLPNLLIKDSPAFEFRCFHIDSCRHFFPVSDIKKMIKVCSTLKFNRFHWHLTDDQGWRIQSEIYPELTEIGSVRHGSHLGKEQNNRDYGGFYTKDELKSVVDYAHTLHIKVVPEFDVPGHTSALLKSIPSLVCGDKNVEIKTTAGVFDDIICAGKEENYKIIFNIFDEICEIFTDDYIHIGGDEAPKKQWKSCPDCQRMIKEHNLISEEQLQGYFINRVAEHLESKGKKVISWNESLQSGNLDKNVTVEMWMDNKKLCKNSENKLIVSDFWHYYTDYPYSMTPLKKVYAYNPKINHNVIGVSVAIWTEYVKDIEYMEYMCFPRFFAVAETAWSVRKPKYKQFEYALSELLPMYKNLNYAEKDIWNLSAGKRISGIIRHFAPITNINVLKSFHNQK